MVHVAPGVGGLHGVDLDDMAAAANPGVGDGDRDPELVAAEWCHFQARHGEGGVAQTEPERIGGGHAVTVKFALPPPPAVADGGGVPINLR